MASSTDADPHGFGPVANGISSSTQKRAKAAVVAAATALEPGERVEQLVCGEVLGHDGVAVLTDRRVIVANSRTFAPDIEAVDASSVTDVKGWAEGGRATLRFTTGAGALIIGDIKEVDSAQAFAGALRAKM